MKKPIILIDGWPLAEKLCGVHNFTKALIASSIKNYQDVDLKVFVPYFSHFENEFRYEHIEQIKQRYGEAISIELFHVNPFFLFVLKHVMKIVGMKKQKAVVRFFWHSIFIKQVIKSVQPAIVVYPTQEIGASFPNIKKIGIIHDLFGFHHYAVEPKTALFDRLFYLLFYKRVYTNRLKQAHTLLTVSNATKIDLHLFFGISLEKITTIYEGALDTFENFSPNQEKQKVVREKYQLPQEYILTSNPESYRKYPISTLGAFKELVKQMPIVKLVLFGTGKNYTLDKLVKHFGLTSNILFLDEITAEDMPYLYHGALCFIFDSLAEGFGLPILEAIWSKTAVIATCVSPLYEIYQDKICYVDPFNEQEIFKNLHMILSDSQKRKEIIAKQSAITNKYRWSLVTAKLADILNKQLRDI